MATLSDFISLRSDKERAAVEQFIKKREQNQVLWATRPNPSLLSCTDWRLLLLFGVYWLMFTACWTAGMVQQGQPQYALFSIPFWLVGLGCLLHPFYRRARRRRCLYVLTARRAYVLEPQLFRWEGDDWSLKPGLLRARCENADGSGDLLFAHSEDYVLARDGWRGLPDVRLAEAKLAAALGLEPLADSGLDALPAEQRDAVGRVLLTGERLCWVGQPRPCVEWRGNMAEFELGIGALIFALVLTVALTRGEGETELDALLIFGGFALIMYTYFACYGLKPFWRRWQLARTTYVLTNRRAVIVQPGTTHAYPLRSGMVVSRVQKRDGSGDLVMEELLCGKPGQNIRRGFLHVPDVRAVEHALQAARELKA